MRPTALRVEQYRKNRAGMESEPGARWGWFVCRRLGYDLRMMSSGETEGNPHSLGWEHVSVSRSDGKVPTWEDMCFAKDLFWDDEEAVVQFHPEKSKYVNYHPGVLHLWRYLGGHATPPTQLLAPEKTRV